MRKLRAFAYVDTATPSHNTTPARLVHSPVIASLRFGATLLSDIAHATLEWQVEPVLNLDLHEHFKRRRPSIAVDALTRPTTAP